MTKKLKLYILKPKRTEAADNLMRRGYDNSLAHVVYAYSPKQARRLASEDGGDQGPEVWTNAEYSTCKELKTPKVAGIVISDHEMG